MAVKKEETKDFMELVHEASGTKKGKMPAPIKKEIKKEMPMQIKTQRSETDIEKILVENFVSLQKVMTNLAVKFDTLSDNISKLLELFEISAKTLAEKGAMGEDKKILEKLDSLLEHNKVIAKGIALLHEKNMPEEEVIEIPSQPIQSMQRQMPMQMPRPAPRMMPPMMRPAESEKKFTKPLSENHQRFMANRE